MIVKNLWFRKTRTLLTALGIAVGVAAVLAFSAFGEGFASGFERMFSSSSADLTVTQKDAIMAFLSAVDESLGDEIRQLPGVKEVTGSVVGIVQMPEAPYFIVTGEDPRSPRMQHYRLVEGQSLSGNRQILLGTLAAKNFEKKVGQTFRVNDMSYRVVGIYETGAGLEDGGAVMSLADAQRAFDKRGQVNYFNVMVTDARRIDEVKREIQARWKDLGATRSGEATKQDQMLGMYRSFGWFLGIFAVAVGGLGMMNATTMSVFERTREIGVLRAVGWRRRRVIGMILGESLILALIGGLVGIALGVGLTSLAQLSPAVQSMLQGVYRPDMFVQALATALLLGAVGGLYPAWRAARLQPIEAMRQESGAGVHWGRGTQRLARLFGSSALRNLWRRPLRTVVTVAGIGIGVGFVVMLIAMADGMASSFSSFLSAGQNDLVAEQSKTSDMSLSTIDERVVDRLRIQPEVKAVSRLAFGVTSGSETLYLFIFGLDPHEEFIKHYRIREGRLISQPREIMLGRAAADSTKKKVGDRLHVAGFSYQVVGIYENGVSYEDAGAVLLLKDAQRLFHKPHQVSTVSIALRDSSHAEATARDLEGRFPELLITQPSTLSQRTQDFATMNAVLGALIVLTVVVGGIVMMNAMLMSVFERTQEIGVLRALGWRRRRVLRMILGESLALSLLSSAVGIALGIGLGSLLTLDPSLGSYLIPAYTPQMLVKVLALALLLGAVGGLYPAWRATNLQPIEALRYE